MNDGETATVKAVAMLSAFASVGAKAFNMTLTDINGEKVAGGYRPNTPFEHLRRTIGRLLQDAERNRLNVIIRPRSSTTTLIQLDDLDSARAKRIAPHSIIVFQTSPANYQAWVAVEAGAPEDFSRRLRKGAGADPTASGSTRIAGSINFKTKYAPAFPQIETLRTNTGHITSMAALEQAGFVTPKEQPRPPRPAFARTGRFVSKHSDWKKWPSYEICLNGAPKGTSGNPKRSLADFTWCRTAIEWGFSIEATASHLMEVSTKAKQNGGAYALLTATRAAESVERNPYREKVTPGLLSIGKRTAFP
ncbi:MAG: DNA-primase RepB domain-containing protein [Limisphaerales bacterium]